MDILNISHTLFSPLFLNPILFCDKPFVLFVDVTATFKLMTYWQLSSPVQQ